MEYYEEAHEEIQGLYFRRLWEKKIVSASAGWDNTSGRDGYAWYLGDKELDKWLFMGASVEELPADRHEHHDDQLYIAVMDHGIEWQKIEDDGGTEAKKIAEQHSRKKVMARHPLTGDVVDITDLQGAQIKVLTSDNDLGSVIDEFNSVEPGAFLKFAEFKKDIFGYVQNTIEEDDALVAENFINSLICETRSKVIHLGVAPHFFTDERGRDLLLNKIIVPLVEGVKPEKVAIVGPAWGAAVDDILDNDKLELVFLDQETIQVFRAEMERDYIADTFSIDEWDEDLAPDWERMEFVHPVWDAMK